MADDYDISNINSNLESPPVISPSHLPGYGSRKEDDHPFIPKGLTQEQRNADHLMEFFAGLGLVHCDKFRRFIVITNLKPEPRWLSWQHIELYHGPKEFMRVFKIEHARYVDKIKIQGFNKAELPHHLTPILAPRLTLTFLGAGLPRFVQLTRVRQETPAPILQEVLTLQETHFLQENLSPQETPSLQETLALQEAPALTEARKVQTVIVQETHIVLESLLRHATTASRESPRRRETRDFREMRLRKEAQISEETHTIRGHIAELSELILWSLDFT
ncbi:Chromo domain protein [Aspergillus sclerotialis]|uniref:Chromo domain protein n=1 Tax=Aspergillus sclerotialis TaxID=2070753 RepID=A0A3A2Z9R7_9EURO|nr:Chromo domain protein [Aspergillus sclerotialis]